MKFTKQKLTKFKREKHKSKIVTDVNTPLSENVMGGAV